MKWLLAWLWVTDLTAAQIRILWLTLPHPGRLAVQYACGVLVAEAQLQPHGVSVNQPLQDAQPPMEGVVAWVSGSGHPGADPSAGRSLLEELPHLFTQPGNAIRHTRVNYNGCISQVLCGGLIVVVSTPHEGSDWLNTKTTTMGRKQTNRIILSHSSWYLCSK